MQIRAVRKDGGKGSIIAKLREKPTVRITPKRRQTITNIRKAA